MKVIPLDEPKSEAKWWDWLLEFSSLYYMWLMITCTVLGFLGCLLVVLGVE